MNNEVLRPLLGTLQKTSQSLLVLQHRPSVELFGVRLPHDHVHEILVTTESVAIAHERKKLGSILHFDGGGKHVAVAVLLLTVYEKITGNLVVLDPNVDRAHDLPFVDRAILLVQGAEVPCRFHAFFRNVPESTCPWETYWMCQ